MADIYNGKARSFELYIVKTIDGITTETLFEPSILKAFANGFSEINSEEYLKLSDQDFDTRLNAYYDYVNSVVADLNLPTDLTVPAEINDNTCTGTSGPEITLSKSTIDYGNVVINNEYVEQYNVDGINLLDNITVTVPENSGFTISLEANASFGHTLSLLKNADNKLNKTVYVKFSPQLEDTYNSTISHSSNTATTETLSLTGISSVAHFVVSNETLNFGTIPVGNTGILSYSISGDHLGNNESVVVSASPGYTLSKYSNGTYNSTVIYQVGVTGILNPEDVYVKFKPTAEKNYSGRILHKCGSLEEPTPELFGEGVSSAIPNIIVDPAYIDFGGVELGQEVVASYNVSGTYLSNDIILSINGSEFTHSFDANTNFTSSNLMITPTNGTASNTTIYVKFRPEALDSYYNTAQASSTGANTEQVVLNGRGAAMLIFDADFTGTGNDSYEDITSGETIIGHGTVGATNNDFVITAKNPNGEVEENVTVSSVTYNNSNGYFLNLEYSNPLPWTIVGPDGSETITVPLLDTQPEGTYTCQVTVNYSAGFPTQINKSTVINVQVVIA